MMTILKFLAVCLLLWFIALATLPFVLNTNAGKRFVQNQLKKSVPGDLQIQSFSLSWSGPQRFENGTYTNVDKTATLHFKEIQFDNSLLSFIVPGTWNYFAKTLGADVDIKTKNDSSIKIEGINANSNFKADIYTKRLFEISLLLIAKDGDLALFAKDDQGVLTLQKPLEANVSTTSDLGKLVLQKFLPFIKGVAKTEKPLKVVIFPEGFKLPFKKFDWSKLQIGKAMIDLGKITLQNTGPLSNIVNLLAPAKPAQINLWLTPAYISMNNGIIYLDRIDMLALDKFSLALWGKIDLPNDKLKLTLGIPTKALKGIVDIPAVMGKEMFLLPLTGSLKESEIDTSSIKANMGQLAVQLLGKIAQNLRGSAKDKDKNDEESKKVDINSDIPVPTTNPLPWEAN